MVRTGRLATLLSATALAIGATAAISMPSATAMPDSCTTGGYYAATAWALCTSGTGHYNVHIECTDELRDSSGWYDGPVVSIGHKSSKTCPYLGGVQWVATFIVIYDD